MHACMHACIHKYIHTYKTKVRKYSQEKSLPVSSFSWMLLPLDSQYSKTAFYKMVPGFLTIYKVNNIYFQECL